MSTIRISRHSRLLRQAAGLALVATLAIPGSAFAGRSTIVKVSGYDLLCPFDTPAARGTLQAITRDRSDGGSFAFVDLFIEPTDPSAPVLSGGMDDPPLTASGLDATFDMNDDATGDVLGTAHVAAVFTSTGVHRVRRIYQRTDQMGLFETFTVAGTLTVATSSASYAFDLGGCEAGGQDRMDQIHDPSGPKAGGPAPANDLPSAAAPVAPGSRLQEWTGGAALDPEADCLVTFNGEVFTFEWGRTVWFSLVGTGGPVTIDPRGSNFDSVVAAYTPGANGLDQVGCVDDDSALRTAQGPLTIDTRAGVTYLIQVGGVNGNIGSDSADPQWGRLRLAVS